MPAGRSHSLMTPSACSCSMADSVPSPNPNSGVDRSAFSVTTLADGDAQDRAWWWAQTPEFRLQEMQRLREIVYGDAATGSMERVL